MRLFAIAVVTAPPQKLSSQHRFSSTATVNFLFPKLSPASARSDGADLTLTGLVADQSTFLQRAHTFLH